MELLRAWLTAYETKVLIVRHATNYDTKVQREAILHLAQETGCDLALTCGENTGENLAEWVDRQGGTIHPNSVPLLTRLSGMHTEESGALAPGTVSGGEFPVLVPRVDFYLYRAKCRDLLTPGEFATVDALYRSIFTHVQASPFPDDETAAEYLRETATTHPSAGEVVTVTRAAQAAMFTHATLMKVDLHFFIDSVRHGEHAGSPRARSVPCAPTAPRGGPLWWRFGTRTSPARTSPASPWMTFSRTGRCAYRASR